MHARLAAALALLLLPAARRRPDAGRSAPRRSATARSGSASPRGPGSAATAGTTSPSSADDEDDEWESDCEPGPVRVSLRVRGRPGGRRPHLRRRPVASRPEGKTTDLGQVPARQAAADLLALVEQRRADAEELVTAATLADSAVVWPVLLRIARAHRAAASRRGGRRSSGWARRRGEAATRGLDSIATDGGGELEVRKQAVFALSQRPADEGVPALIRIARSNPHAELRKSALFWLGQSEDPRALALFEEILR